MNKYEIELVDIFANNTTRYVYGTGENILEAISDAIINNRIKHNETHGTCTMIRGES